MGYRGQHNRDLTEEEIYRRTVPRRTRILYQIRAIVIVGGLVLLIVGAAVIGQTNHGLLRW